MAAPQLIEQTPLSLAEVKEHLHNIEEKRKEELNYLSNKVKEYLETFVKLDAKKANDLKRKLVDLDLTRIKEEHIAKIIDFLPSSVDELKVILQSYPLSLPKKDQESIVKVTKEFTS